MRILVLLFVALYTTLTMAADQVSTPSPEAQPATQSAAPASPSTTATEAPKQESIGQVIWTKGQVSASLPNQTKRMLSRKAAVYREDTVESDKSSTAQINLTDGTLLAIAENTKIQIEKYNYDKKEPSKDSYVANLAKGGLRTITGEIGKNNPEETKTKTPVATLTTLGTDYSVIVKGNKDTLISVRVGKIIAKNQKGQVIELGKFDQRFAMISAANQNIAILKSMPADFDKLNATKFENKNLYKSSGSVGGGFCVGK